VALGIEASDLSTAFARAFPQFLPHLSFARPPFRIAQRNRLALRFCCRDRQALRGSRDRQRARARRLHSSWRWPERWLARKGMTPR